MQTSSELCELSDAYRDFDECNDHNKKMIAALLLVKKGLENGSVKAREIISFNDDAESCKLESLLDIVTDALLNTASNANEQEV